MFDRRLFTNFDWTLLALVLIICAAGVVNIYSASHSYRAMAVPFYVKQMYWTAAGLGLCLTVCSLDYHIMEDFSYWLYGGVLVLLLLVLVAGKTTMGATRWINLGLFNMQPSEPMKIVIIMTFARFFSRQPVFHQGLGLKDLALPLTIVGVPAALIMKQPDLGTATLVTLIAGTMLLYVGVRWSALASLFAAFVPVVWVAWNYLLHDYQKNRVYNFLNPDLDPRGTGYHIIQSKIAVGSGATFGKGYLQGTQSQLRFLPEQHTDFAFSVFAEEWGFVGCLVMLFLYLFLVLWGLGIAKRCNDRFGSLMAVGVSAMLFWHILINMGMVIGLFPVVGVPLPFFSYGGTSMVTSMVGVGILLNISMRRFMF